VSAVAVASMPSSKQPKRPWVRRQRVGADGRQREHVSEIQRLRILAAMGEVAAERGAGQVTVAHVVARAGVSRRTFYDLFEDREECFLAAFDEAVGQAAVGVLGEWQGQGSWRERARGALGALLVFCDAHPAAARLCVVEALAAGPKALAARRRILAVLIAAVDEGRAAVPKGSHQPPPLTADGVVGAVFAVVHARLSEPQPGPLGGLLGELMGMIVLPYLGPAGARRELSRPNPLPLPIPTQLGADPLGGLGMRITYRTVRVLMTIAANPGASNREVAAQAGISDQGQVSKLLTRLEHLGLAVNRGEGPAKGAPNAWVLTDHGQRVEQAIRVQTTPVA
jgi:AcrR family transcriptional regulator/DNA-binding MarR family transcriptional regulator